MSSTTQGRVKAQVNEVMSCHSRPRIDTGMDLSWACGVIRDVFGSYVMINPHFTPHIIKYEGGFPMGGAYSVKDTKEVMQLVKVVTVAMLKEIKKDGFQMSDVATVMQSPEFMAAVAPAMADAAKIPFELKELDFMDGLELGREVYSVTMAVVEALKA